MYGLFNLAFPIEKKKIGPKKLKKKQLIVEGHLLGNLYRLVDLVIVSILEPKISSKYIAS